MDKKSIFGFVLIGIILFSWFLYMSNQQKKQAPVKQAVDSSKVVKTDSLKKSTENTQIDTASTKQTIRTDTSIAGNYGKLFEGLAIENNRDNKSASEKIIIIESKKARMEFTNYGGTIRKFFPRDYKAWNGDTLQLISWTKGKELNLLFTSKEGKLINTKDFVFKSDYPEWQKVNIDQEKNFKLKYELVISADSSQKIVKTYTFIPDSYEFDVKYEFVNSGKFISGSEYEVMWGSSLNLTEYYSTDEATFSEAYAYMGTDIETYSASKFKNEFNPSVDVKKFSGVTHFVCSRNKYFGAFIIPLGRKGDGTILTGYKEHLKDEGVKNEYAVAMLMEIKNEILDTSTFQILISPIDYKILKGYDKNLEKTMRFSLDFIVRPIAQYMIIPFFTFLHMFIPNYGFVIIIFAICLKIVLNPLTKKQMTSMRRMGQLNPKMTAIREKYKEDPQKMNKMIMNLYKEEGINPMSGCLPMILQLPILYALFGVFRSTIELRQANFIWWIKDLSAPDILFHLPFKLPLIGIDQISGLATLMGITMFIQQKMTVTDPKQKAMVYIMPVFLTLLFFSFPSGLNLYYFIFNLLSIGQQYYNTKIKPPTVEEMTKKPKKESFMQKMMKRSEEIRKSRDKR